MLIINGIASRRMTHDQFGLWSILYSLNLLSNCLDFGFRFTLGNRLAALGSRGADAEEERRETFLAILYLQTAIAAALMVLFIFVFPLLPWAHWFKITDPLFAAQVLHLMPIVTVVMIATLPVALMWTVFFAYQEIKLASFLAGAATILQTCLFVVAAYRVKFSWVMLIFFGSNFAIGFALTAYVFIRRKWRFTLLPFSRIAAATRSMARVSFHAFLSGLSNIISMILGPIVSGAVSGLNAAGDYTLVQKLFSLLVTAHLAMMAPLGPAITLESHSGNWDAVRRRLRTCVLQLWPAVFIGLGAVMLSIHPYVIRIWAGKWLQNYRLAALLLIWACLNGFANTFAVFLNSLGLVKVQAVISLIMVVPSVFLSAFLGRWLGPWGIALSAVICTLPCVIIWPLYTRRALRLHMLRV
jgi:O-antigen/teichoic acid export membrane protein